jgi:hypothetical protein
MRKQYHFKRIGSDVCIWDVHQLIALSKSFPVIEVDLTDIKELNENFWYQYPEDIPTCKSICDHFILMKETDLRYPIILNADGSVMDGMHRVCKAYIQNKQTIKAVQFSTMPEPHFRNLHPDELAYD